MRDRKAVRRTKRRRKVIILSTLLASLLVGGAAVASTDQEVQRRPTPQHEASELHVWRLYGGPLRQLLDHLPERPAPKPTPTAKPTPKPTVKPTPKPTVKPTPDPTQKPTQKPPASKPPAPKPEPPQEEYNGPFPTKETTGPRVAVSALRASKSVVSQKDGQVISGLDISSKIKIINDNVTVRDSRLKFTGGEGSYGVHIAKKNDGQCPENVVIEYVEVSGGSGLSDETIAVYSPCPYTLRNSRIFDVGSAVRITNGAVIENNYIHANLVNPGSDSHRSAIGLNGGRDHRIVGNTIDCEGRGCSGALVMYGDFNQVQNVLIQSNLFNTTGSYCTYGGSLASKKYPTSSNVRYIDNHFGRKYSDTCGKYGPVTGTSSGNGNVWSGNVWDDTGKPL